MHADNADTESRNADNRAEREDNRRPLQVAANERNEQAEEKRCQRKARDAFFHEAGLLVLQDNQSKIPDEKLLPDAEFDFALNGFDLRD